MGVLEDFRQALQAGESDTVEFVSEVTSPRFAQTVCAFANGRGGVVYVGVTDTPDEPTGSGGFERSSQGVDADTVRQFARNLERFFDDPLPEVEVIEVGHVGPKGPIIAVRVKPRTGNELVALKDLTTWGRRGPQNEPGVARARAIRPATHDVRMQGGARASGSADVEVVKGRPQVTGETPSEEGGAAESSTARPDPDAAGDVPPPTVTQEAPGASGTPPPSPPEGGGVAGDEPGDESNRDRRPSPRLGTGILLRREATDAEASLSAEDYAEVIASLLTNSDNDERMTFALFGHWGRGKTYLANRVKNLLERGQSRYTVVKFSAWKYRTTPEIWAYLFQQFFEAGRKVSAITPFRAALVRHGPWPLLFAMTGLFFAQFTFSEKAQIVMWLARTLGIATLVYLLYLIASFRSTAIRLLVLYSFTGHADKLGMQAAIGDDLRALLKAWIPSGLTWECFKRHWLAAMVYVVVALALLWKLWPVPPTMVIVPVRGPVETNAEPEVMGIVCFLWGVIATLFAVFVVPWTARASRRVLLVIDDLDRCAPQQMLEIIESVLLILDDEETSRRLQVVMLIDESAFRHAVIQKYKYLTDKIDVGNEHLYNSHRIVRENQEKFFLAHLRLPQLSNEEIDEVTRKFAGELRKHSTDAETPATLPPEQSVSSPPSGAEGPPSEPPPGKDAPVLASTPGFIGEEEMAVICGAVKDLAESEGREAIGPRTIRCLLFRYQLARSILIRLNMYPDARQLAESVVSCYFAGPPPVARGRTLLDRVVSQVS